jgi:MraZ protein
MVFYGEFLVSSSGTGRFLLPKKIRELLTTPIFILTKGFDNCLHGYNKDDWEKRTMNFFKEPIVTKDQLIKQRFIFSSLVYIEIDPQGRFVIPKNLINYADLKDQIVVIGAGDHFEVWKPENWEKYQKESFNQII